MDRHNHSQIDNPPLAPVDPPFPWVLKGREGNIHFHTEVTSTMDEARQLVRAGCPSFYVVVAETQTSGRGRLDRTWTSQAGGLYFTMILRPNLSPAECYKLNFLTSIILVRVLRRIYGIDAGIKWPNDILVNRRKLVGMLSDIGIQRDRVDYVNIGIGINVNNTPPRTTPEATSIKECLGRPVPRQLLLAEFLDEFEVGMKGLTEMDLISEWKRCSIPLQKPVTVVTTQGEYRGIAEDIDSDGGLLLRRSDGSLKKILYGDCFI